MASVRINVHRQSNPVATAKKFLNDQKKHDRKVYWDRLANGISFCAGGDWMMEAARHKDRYIEVRNELDLEEVFRNYENEE